MFAESCAATTTTASSPAKAVKLGGQLRSSVRVMDRLTSSHLDHLVASRRSGDAVSRDSLAALYSLATKLHSPALRFASNAIETSRERHITTEQIWGQLSMLLRPVLRQLQEGVRKAEKLYGDGTEGRKEGNKRRRAAQQLRRKEKADADDASDASDKDEDLRGVGGSGAAADDVLSTRTSELDESDLDEEIADLLQRQAAKKKAKGKEAKKDDDGADAWRYAFGKSNLDEDDEEEDDDDWDGEDSDRGTSRRRRREEAAADEEAEEDEDDDEKAGDRRTRDRNLRAMADADDEEEENDADEELAALKELYGEDFEDDGRGFVGDEEDEDPGLAEDIELDDPANEDGRGGDAAAYSERDGIYFGKGDILNDEAGDFEGAEGGLYGDEAAFEDEDGFGDETGDHGGADGEAEEEMDEELEAALRDPNLSDLQKERLREQHMVRKMEEKRLFGTDWSMTGETAANKRQRDALLEVDDLEFEYGMKATPVVTEAFTAKLEDRIRQRIQDENFDDVQRKTTLSTEADIAKPKYDAALDAQKSKMSLMDLYEKEFLEKQRLAEEGAGGPGAPSAEPLTEIEKDELRAIQMWQRLAQHLDALSNFHFTPKPVQQDLDARVRAVENQAPAVVIENVGNFATTRENALAPQDLYRGSSHRFADVGTDELTPKERHALRRAKKETGKKDKERKEDRDKQRKEARRKKSEEEAVAKDAKGK
ncbi:putative U3 small nucleolar ribonucleoprotein MPP10 [Leptomonas pyrrhocoris]|uniref:Putative U3 small nucleolar ribonucleoprotein MPP10 n=1 Tax=Leptomonas pyrrhocoris TaxID=157538 RepID=A0A0N0DVI5_LEPPY|nr:putative U3 small nucleolar ribonucleoprotein MPP10 [Leptomonas pyrrhocoris]KPA80392.1 putative U3 small nucleolar ribonucleoprotein MPP10 [Leptomonas pyrrhocoris]|eukprot:XP_015658831.1 putative U3 small nucleolar ribonucleoprotein MPP10 [Leptomonas pyrrhocoris]